MLFYRTEFSFNESAWGSHCPMSLRNLTLAYNKICLTFSQRGILQFQLERHQWSCLAVLSKSKRKRRSIGRDFMGSGSWRPPGLSFSPPFISTVNDLVLCFSSWVVLCLVAQSCPTLCDLMDCSPPGSSVHGDSPGKYTGVGCHPLLQGIFPTQESNPGLLHCRRMLYHLKLSWVTYPQTSLT